MHRPLFSLVTRSLTILTNGQATHDNVGLERECSGDLRMGYFKTYILCAIVLSGE